jgi:hypothetical protein
VPFFPWMVGVSWLQWGRVTPAKAFRSRYPEEKPALQNCRQ